MDLVRGRDVNVLQGLELHVPVLDETEQSIMKAAIDRWCELGSQVRSLLLLSVNTPTTS